MGAKGGMIMQRLSEKTKEKIANNLVDFMERDVPLLEETRLFIRNWVGNYDGSGRRKGYYDVWNIVLSRYLPKERPILFRSCKRLSKLTVQSFTGEIACAERFSDGHKGHILVCDTKEYLQFERIDSIGHRLGFFPLHQCIKKARSFDEHCFSEKFYEVCEKEDEYIVRVNYNWLYDLKWIKGK